MKPLDKYTAFLIEQAQAGRKNSYLELIGFYKKKVYLRSLQLLGKTEDAEKVSREVFFRAWKNIKLVNEYIPFELWLRGLTINIAMSHYRNSANPESGDFYGTDNLSAENEYDNKFLSFSIKARQILILHDLEGYSFADIAALLEEKEYSDFGNLLTEARFLLTDENESKIFFKLENDEWERIVSDFDVWSVEKSFAKNMTRKIKAFISYRGKLESLLSSNEPSEETFEKLINYFFIHGEKVVEKRRKEKEIWKASFAVMKDEKTKHISNAKKKSDKPGKKKSAESITEKSRRKKKNTTLISLGFAAVVVILFLLFYHSNNFPWKVASSYGKYLIASMDNQKEIDKGDEIKTSSGSEVAFQIKTIGGVVLKENTTAKALSGNKDETVIELIKGTLLLSTKTETQKLTITGNDFKLYDYGSETALSADSQKISVKQGKVKLFYKGKEYPVLKNYEYNFGKVSPVNIYADPELTAAVDQMNAPVKFDANLDKVLSLAGESDALTIWTLLRYSDKGAAGALFRKLNEFFPLGENISRNDILNLNINEIDAWLDEIEWQL